MGIEGGHLENYLGIVDWLDVFRTHAISKEGLKVDIHRRLGS